MVVQQSNWSRQIDQEVRERAIQDIQVFCEKTKSEIDEQVHYKAIERFDEVIRQKMMLIPPKR